MLYYGCIAQDFCLNLSDVSLSCYSPDAMDESKQFITSVILGKDIVPRLGLAQVEYFRTDILQLLKHSTTPKVSVCLYINYQSSMLRESGRHLMQSSGTICCSGMLL